MAKKENKNTITVKQSNKLGFKLTDVKTGLQTLRATMLILLYLRNTLEQIMGYCAMKQITF